MALMIDTVEIHIPFFKTYCKSVTNTVWQTNGDVSDYIPIASSRHVSKTSGINVPFELYHSYESIPTSHTGIGFKLMHRTNNCLPHVILNCSIAKILQGHNVFGCTDMITGVFEMLGVFKDAYPNLSPYLDYQSAELARFDITLPVQTQSLFTAERVRDYLRNVDYGRYRNLSVSNKKDTYNTIYYGALRSKTGGFKIYCKGIEIAPTIKKLKKDANKGCLTSNHKLNHVYTDDVIKFAEKSVRIEVTVKKRTLKENHLDVNLWDFLSYQINNQHIYKRLFKQKTDEFLKALQGMTMNNTDDIKIWDNLHEKLTTITPTGKVSTAKASTAYNFYKRLKDDGYKQVKATTHIRTFQRNIKILADAGYSRSDLQNFTKENNQETQILRILNLDFDAKNPPSYTQPTTQYFDEFKKYFVA